ncbi:MAG: hypothetical protein OEV92_09015 [Nitrospinota bacterium]|nr:hypothetical protein [Nitrospinota bacterium]
MLKSVLFKRAVMALTAVLLAAGLVEFQGCGDVKTTTDQARLAAPVGLTASAGDGQNTITWNLVSGASSYNLYWDTQAGVSVLRRNLRVGTKISGINSTYYSHGGLANGTTYYYLVTAVSPEGLEGAPSAEASATPGAATTCVSPNTACDGSCVNLSTNSANCGACGAACPAGQTCSGGVCAVAAPSCPSGTSICSAACVNLKADRNNCGTCANSCSPTTVCIQGACGACPATYIICNGQCVSPSKDVNNCGSCGTACGAGKSCISGLCQEVSICPAYYITCSGTCMYPAQDINNCGGCGISCGSSAKYCVSGVCY